MSRIQPEDYPSRSELAYDEHGPYPEVDGALMDRVEKRPPETTDRVEREQISRGVLLAAAENEANAYRNWVHARAFGHVSQIAARGKDLARARHRFTQAKADHTRVAGGSSSNMLKVTREVLERTSRRAIDLIRRAATESYSDDVAAEASAVISLLKVARRQNCDQQDQEILGKLIDPQGRYFARFLAEWEGSGALPLHRSEYYRVGVGAIFGALLSRDGQQQRAQACMEAGHE